MWERWPLSLRPGSACSSVHCPGPADAADLRRTHLMQPGTRPSSHGNRPRRAWQGTPGRHVPLGMRPGQPGRPAAAPCPPEPSLCRWAGAPASEPSVRVHGAAPAAVGRASGRPLPCRSPQRWPAVTPRAGRPSPPAERGQHAALAGVSPLRPPVPRLCLTPPSRPPCGPVSDGGAQTSWKAPGCPQPALPAGPSTLMLRRGQGRPARSWSRDFHVPRPQSGSARGWTPASPASRPALQARLSTTPASGRSRRRLASTWHFLGKARSEVTRGVGSDSGEPDARRPAGSSRPRSRASSGPRSQRVPRRSRSLAELGHEAPTVFSQLP